jgi:M6 family metalloprotease-like protein
MNRVFKQVMILLMGLILVTGCGGGGGDSETIIVIESDGNTTTLLIESDDTSQESKAYLVDAAVEGVGYKTNTKEGLTQSDGSFLYAATDQSVRFSVGGVFIADFNLTKLNSDKTIFITDLMGVERGDTRDPQVVKVLQFLQSLDASATQELMIPSATTESLRSADLNLSDPEVTQDDIRAILTPLSLSLVDEESAVKELEQSLSVAGYSVDSFAPVFNSANSLEIEEDKELAFHIDVSDASSVTYALSGVDASYFSIENTTATLQSSIDFDYETKNSYVFTITATDSFGNSNSQDFVLHIKDVEEVQTKKIPMLVIVMNWDDYREADSSLWYDKFFNLSTNSVNRYYMETSSEKVEFDPAKESSGVHDDGVIMVEMGKNHPGGYNETSFRDTEIYNAITNTEVVNNIDFASYDTNGDGVISVSELQIIFIVAGGEQSYGDNVSHSIWAHSWSFDSDSYPVVDGVGVMKYDTDQERSGTYSRFGASHGDHPATIGIIAHELGHSAFNLFDYYDNGGGSGLGIYDIMSGGSWAKQNSDRYDGATPTQFSIYNKIDANFDNDIHEITQSTTLTIQCGKKEGVKLITSDENEYFLLECRDTSMANSDISFESESSFSSNNLFAVLYHVDEEKSDNTEDGDQTASHHYKLALVEKDSSVLMTNTTGIYADYADIYLSGDTIESGKTTLYDGTRSGYAIEVSGSDYTARTMTFTITKE